jgi:DNA-binding MarR family transcriptional regulator
MTRLTLAQRTVLVTARDHGHALANTGMRSRAGGAVVRMIDRLVMAGLLTKPPHKITAAGRKALMEHRP